MSWSSLSRKFAGGACLIGALRALGQSCATFLRLSTSTVLLHVTPTADPR